MGDWAWASWTAGGVLALIGLITLLWALRGERSRGRRRCPRCWYDMARVPGATCPECGRTQRTEKRFFRPRRRWRAVCLGVFLLLLSGAVAVAPAAYTGQWVRWTPSSVLRLVLSLYPKDAKDAYEKAAAANFGPVYVQSLSTWQRLLLAYGCRENLRIPPPLDDPLGLLGWHSRGKSPFRATAYEIVSELGDEAIAASDVVLELFSETGSDGKKTGLTIVQRLGLSALPMERSILRLIRSAPEADTRQTAIAAAVALSRTQTATPARTIAALHACIRSDADARVRSLAIYAAYDLQPDDSLRDLLVRRVRDDPDPLARRSALDRLSNWHQLERSLLGDATLWIPTSRAAESYWLAYETLQTVRADIPNRPTAFTPPSPSAIIPFAHARADGFAPLLIEVLRDNSPEMRIMSAEFLAQMGPNAKDALPAITEALKTDTSADARAMLLYAFTSIERSQPGIDLMLAELRRDPLVEKSSIWCIEMLGKYGDTVPDGLPAVDRVMQEHAWAVKPGVKAFAADTAALEPILRRLLRSSREDVRAATFAAISDSVPECCALADDLRNGLTDSSKYTRFFATRLLARCPDSYAETHARAITAFTCEADDSVRYDQLTLLNTIERSDPVTYRGGLTASLTNPFWHIRVRGIVALGDLGPAAMYAVPELTKCLSDEQPEVRDAATAALAKIWAPGKGPP